MMKFNEVLNMVKGSDLKVLTEGKSYFTVENEEGFRAYCQAEVFGYDLDNENCYKGYNFSTVHQPNRKTGTGWQEFKEVPVNSEEQFFNLLNKTLEKSEMRIKHGKERMDTRKPHENGQYLI